MSKLDGSFPLAELGRIRESDSEFNLLIADQHLLRIQIVQLVPEFKQRFLDGDLAAQRLLMWLILDTVATEGKDTADLTR
mgnify:CR=1 FL=1